jgi:acyl-CoA thioesterase I
MRRALCFAIALLAATGTAQANPAETCLKAAANLSLGAALPRVKAAILQRKRLLIVAIGSSSTRGVGASSWAATYPEVMQRELMRLRPGISVEIINSGSNGETIPGQLSRMQRDALAPKPDLVIWQLGANDVIFRLGGLPDDLGAQVAGAVREIRSAGTDAILMDLQNAPMVTGSSTHQAMLGLVADSARATGAGLFRRFDLMQRAVSAGVSLGALTSWDSLHSTDAAYDCVGRAIARQIDQAAR